MDPGLIFDVGCNNGDDTDFYLRKGFRVLAIDADPAMCAHVSLRFHDQVKNGALSVLNGLISDASTDSAPFYLFKECPGWNTADLAFKSRVEKAGHKPEQITVPVHSISDILSLHGVPYYMKVDIEGNDLIAINGLSSFIEKYRDRPKYVSIEYERHDIAVGLEQLMVLSKCGYSKFLFVNQGMRLSVIAPNPPREGKFAEFQPMQITTGLFGQELDGRWVDLCAASARVAEICRLNALFRDDPRYSKNGQFSGTLRSKLYNRYRRHVLGDPINGIELHATS
jgi:FkbM family methyltransferase